MVLDPRGSSSLPDDTTRRDRGLSRPKHVARWVAGMSAASAVVMTGLVAHELPGAAAASTSGSHSSTNAGSSSTGAGPASTGTAGAGATSNSGDSGSSVPSGPSISSSTGTPVVQSGGSSVR